MKKITDISSRVVRFTFENIEIESLLLDRIRNELELKEGDETEFNFEFIKAGSPEYSTNKIKCTATIKRFYTPQ
jgi:hypothetical protein